MISTIPYLMSSSKEKTNHNLDHALSELNQAIEEWDTITNKPQPEQDLSHKELQKKTKDLLVKLQKQLTDFSKQ